MTGEPFLTEADLALTDGRGKRELRGGRGAAAAAASARRAGGWRMRAHRRT